MGLLINTTFTDVISGKPITVPSDGEDSELVPATTATLLRALAEQLPRDFTTPNDDACFSFVFSIMRNNPNELYWTIPPKHFEQLFGVDGETGIVMRDVPNMQAYMPGSNGPVPVEGRPKVIPLLRAMLSMNTTGALEAMRGSDIDEPAGELTEMNSSN